jgi:PilZ domain
MKQKRKLLPTMARRKVPRRTRHFTVSISFSTYLSYYQQTTLCLIYANRFGIHFATGRSSWSRKASVVPCGLGRRSGNREVELLSSESRRWPRLPVAIPVFVRGADKTGKPFLEFTSLLNIGAGGALLVVHQSFPRSSRMVVEIPSPPLADLPLSSPFVQRLNSKVVHVSRSGHYDLLGVKFSRPLAKPATKKAAKN